MRENHAPPTPPAPPHFSPLRPFRRFTRFVAQMLLAFLTAEWDEMGKDRNGAPQEQLSGFGCFGLMAIASCVLMAVGIFIGLVASDGHWTWYWSFPAWWIYVVVGIIVSRLWFRAMLHLDEPLALEWWKERLK